jgi:hypothetical protein
MRAEVDCSTYFMRCAVFAIYICSHSTVILHSAMLVDIQDMYKKVDPQRFTQVGILRALTWPGFFLSTFRGSRVTQPAVTWLAIWSDHAIRSCKARGFGESGGRLQTRVRRSRGMPGE